MPSSKQKMAQRINAVLHDFVDENYVSSSDDDDCSSIESDVEVDVLRDAACGHGERDDHPAGVDGGADADHVDVDQLHVSQLSDEQLLQRLAEASEAANASIDASDAEPSAKKPKKDLGQRWHTPLAKPQKGRRPWSFGHKLYALVKLKEANGNQYHVRTKILPHWQLSKSFLSEWKKAENAIREECRCLASAGTSALDRKRLTGAGRKAIYQQREVAVVAWLDTQLENGVKTHPTVFWDQVCPYPVRATKVTLRLHCLFTAPRFQVHTVAVAEEFGVDTNKLLKKDWRVCFKKRWGICFRKCKRVSLLTPDERAAAVNSFLTYLRAAGHFWKVEAVLNANQAPLSFDGRITHFIVLRGNNGEEISNIPAEDAKRFCTYMPLVGVTLDGQVIKKKPVIVFKGQGNVPQREKNRYDDRVICLFQDKGVVDGTLMVTILGNWFAGNMSPMSMVLDCARRHWTDTVKQEIDSRKLIPARVPAGMTSYIQWLDAFWMFLFKTNYRKVYAQTAHGNIRKLSAGAKRIAVSLLVAEAHEITMKALEPTIFQKFVQFGYIHTEHTRLMKLFTMPSDYKYAKKDDVIQTLQATVLAAAKPPAAPEPVAQPKKKQLSIASFFRPNHNPQ